MRGRPSRARAMLAALLAGMATAQGAATPSVDTLSPPQVQQVKQAIVKQAQGPGKTGMTGKVVRQLLRFLDGPSGPLHSARRVEPIWLGYKRPENHHKRAARMGRRSKA